MVEKIKVQLYFLTSVGWSLDSSGNLQALNTAGTVIAKFLGGAFSAKANIFTPASNTPSNTTSSTTAVSTGYGASGTPQISGRMTVACSGSVSDGTAGVSVTVYLYYKANASTVPAGGTAVGADVQLTSQGITSATANAQGAFSMNWSGSITNAQSAVIYLAWSVSNGASTGSLNTINSANPVCVEE